MLNHLLFSRWRWPALALLTASLFAGCASFDEQQRKWIFQASTGEPPAWAAGRTAGMDKVWIDYRSAVGKQPVRLHALWYANENAAAPLLLYLHGVRRNVDSNAFRIRQMQSLGFSVLAIDYRGFGLSTDMLPSESRVYEDARAAWSWLETQHPQRDRYIFGHSLGGAVAVHLASEVDDAKGLIVEGTFTSIPDVFRTMKWGWLPIEPLITQRFDAADTIAKVKVPVLVVHGSGDQLVRPELGRALYERARQPKRFVLVDGGTHHNTNGMALTQYREAMHALFGLGE